MRSYIIRSSRSKRVSVHLVVFGVAKVPMREYDGRRIIEPSPQKQEPFPCTYIYGHYPLRDNRGLPRQRIASNQCPYRESKVHLRLKPCVHLESLPYAVYSTLGGCPGAPLHRRSKISTRAPRLHPFLTSPQARLALLQSASRSPYRDHRPKIPVEAQQYSIEHDLLRGGQDEELELILPIIVVRGRKKMMIKHQAQAPHPAKRGLQVCQKCNRLVYLRQCSHIENTRSRPPAIPPRTLHSNKSRGPLRIPTHRRSTHFRSRIS